MTDDGTLLVRSFELPFSQLLDVQSRSTLKDWQRLQKQLAEEGPGDWSEPSAIPRYREYLDKNFYAPVVARSRELYAVTIQPEVLAGVYTEHVTSQEDLPAANVHRVLINLHGGGFAVGARCGGQLESIPVAALGRFKVISVDYRMGPEHQFPAATDDVVAVYRHLLKAYMPQSIGIFGCSAGAILTAQTIARLAEEGLPRPGAVGMLSGSGSYWIEGDSVYIGTALLGSRPRKLADYPYFWGASAEDAMVVPSRSSKILQTFPPSLFIAGTRDHLLSSVVHMHTRLVNLGVAAELHVWEGLGHAFFYAPDLRESVEAHNATVRFFDRHLARC